MMLSKITRSLASAANTKAIKCTSIIINKRNFSIEDIGKRYGQPYDYKNKQYGIIGQIFDSTMKRLGENSLIITVEGNFGSGKSEFAKKLAKDIDFVYAREPDLDAHLYELPNGQNMRNIINEIVGDNLRYHIDSNEDFHLQPTFKRAIALQNSYYVIRWMQMRTALLHLMSTGQGVVLERSPFSDGVIAESLYENNLLSENAWRYYARDLVPNTLPELWRPHVIIYLDKSPEDCLKTIREKGKPFERQSKLYSLELLKSVEKNYKKTFLPGIKEELHLLSYDSKEANPERVIEDLEMLDFEDQHKFNDWRMRKETTLNAYRRSLADYNHCLELVKSPKDYIDVPELLLYGDDLVQLEEKLEGDERLHTDKNASLFSPISTTRSQRNWL